MAHDKKHITPENIDEWLSSTGFLLPRNELELARFDRLYSDSLAEITGKEIDPENILNDVPSTTQRTQNRVELDADDFSPYRMAARNGTSIPKHILDKMKKNQNKLGNGSTGSSEEKDQ